MNTAIQGTCPKCEVNVTLEKSKLVWHTLGFKKCHGSGKKPTQVTRWAVTDLDYLFN